MYVLWREKSGGGSVRHWGKVQRVCQCLPRQIFTKSFCVRIGKVRKYYKTRILENKGSTCVSIAAIHPVLRVHRGVPAFDICFGAKGRETHEIRAP